LHLSPGGLLVTIEEQEARSKEQEARSKEQEAKAPRLLLRFFFESFPWPVTTSLCGDILPVN
jgi:hypothetical protein